MVGHRPSILAEAYTFTAHYHLKSELRLVPASHSLAMAMHLGIIPTSTCLLPLLIRRRAAAVHQRKPNHPAPVAFTFHNKSCRFSRLIAPIRSAAGSSGSVSATTYKDISNYLEKVEVFDLSRKAVQIVDLWRDRKAVVAFARHFGCVLCRKRADVLASKKDLMDTTGVALVLIAPGTVDQAIAFFEQTQFKGGSREGLW